MQNRIRFTIVSFVIPCYEWKMNCLKHCFSIACFSTALGMTIYWIYKFWKDEDLAQFDLKPFSSFPQGKYPMMSFCFVNPFSTSSLRRYDTKLTKKKYREILRGKLFYEDLENIPYDDVTLNLADFYLGDSVQFKDGSSMVGEYPNFVNQLPQITYSGFLYKNFYKCYGINSNYKDITYINFRFNSSIYPNGVRINKQFLIFVHIPNQILMAGSFAKLDWPKRTKKKEYAMNFRLQQVEILKRRNKRSKPCMPHASKFDEILLDNHLETVGCKAPYQNTNKNWTICKSREKLKEANLDIFRTKKTKTACTNAATITYTFDEQDLVPNFKGSEWFHVYLMYPEQFKEIVMVKAVDLQTAIGNAGGYVGLFLGN